LPPNQPGEIYVPADPVQRRLAAILAADVAGYSRLMGADEAGTRARVNEMSDQVLRPSVERNRGRLVKTMGDGFLVEFASVIDAVEGAVEIQSDMARREAGVPADGRLALRIGLHLGDVIVEGDDIHGDGVNIAARLEGIAEPGGICVSDMVHAGVRNKLDVAFEDLGEQMLKNIADPVSAFRIVLPDASGATAGGGDTGARRPAIAVLPFDNMSGDPEQEFFSDGLTEEIITALCRWRRFPVIARNSTFSYKGKTPDIREVGRELGARYVVEGSVRKAGDRVRVTAQLINAENGHHIWAERYDRDLADVFAVQDEIAQSIAAIIEPTIDHGERQRIRTTPAGDIDAWELCLRGFSNIYENTVAANNRAIEQFERAIERDPNLGRAHSGLAYACIKDLRYFRTLDRAETLQRVGDAARRAVQLDEMDAEAHAMMARWHMNRGEVDLAIAEARRSTEINPFDPFAQNILGATLCLGAAEYESAIQCFERALQLSPLDPQQDLYLTQLALSELGVERYDDAIAHARDALRRNPGFIEARIALAAATGLSGGRYDAEISGDDFRQEAETYVREHPIYSRALKDLLLDGLGADGASA
jgi:adenylate cyclase